MTSETIPKKETKVDCQSPDAIKGRWHRVWPNLLAFAATFAVFLVTAAFCHSLQKQPGLPSPLWLPAGVAFAAAAFCGSAALWGAAFGSFVVGLCVTYGRVGSLPPRGFAIVVVLSVVTTVQARLGAWLALRHVGLHMTSIRPRDIFALSALAGPISCVVAASAGVGLLCSMGVMPWSQFDTHWLNWWMGDWLGVMIVAIAALAIWGEPKSAARRRLFLVVLPLAIIVVAFSAVFVALERAEEGRLSNRLTSLAHGVREDLRAWFDNAKRGVAEWCEHIEQSTRSASQLESRSTTILDYHDTLTGIGFVSAGNAAATGSLRIDFWRGRTGSKVLREFDGSNARTFQVATDRAQKTGLAGIIAGRLGDPPGHPDDILVVRPVYRSKRNADGQSLSRGELLGFGIAVVDMRVVVRRATRYLPATIERSWTYSPFEAETDRTVIHEGFALRWLDSGCNIDIPIEHAGTEGFIRMHLGEEAVAGQNLRYMDWIFRLGLLLAAMLGSHLLLMSGQTSELQERITERKETERALAESERKYRNLVETSNDLIWSVDSEGRWTFVNRKAANSILGIEPEQMLGRPFTDFQTRARADVDLQVFANLATGKSVYDYQTEHRRSDGTMVELSYNAIPLFDDQGMFLGTTGTAQDISQRKRIEREQREANGRRQRQTQALMWLWQAGLFQPGRFDDDLQTIARVAGQTLDIGRISIWFLDGDRRHIVCRGLFENRPGRHSLGRQLLVSDYPEYFRALEKHRCIAVEDARSDPRTAEFRATYLEPHSIYSMLDAPIRLDEGMQGVLCMEHLGNNARNWSAEDEEFACALADIIALSLETDKRFHTENERKQLEERLWESQKLESLGVLAGGVAHDFNNLLTGILGNANLAAAESSITPRVAGYLQEIERLSQRAAELCQQMLAYAGKGKYVVGPSDLGALVRDSVNLVRFSISKKIELTIHTSDSLPPVLVDANQMRQVVMNLVMNASDAIGESQGRIEITVSLVQASRDQLDGMLCGAELAPGAFVALEVTDTGCGMDAATKARIFEPFFTTKFTGRGLGLAAVLGIIRSHRGALSVSSEPDQGTRFWILLPPSSQTPAKVTEIAHTQLSRPVGHGSILIAEDEESVRQLAVSMLRSAGFKILEAKNGREAVECFELHRDAIRAVVLDLTMPILDGRQTISKLRAIAPNLPVIIMSGYTEAETGLGFDGEAPTMFLQKPFRRNELIQKITELLESKGADENPAGIQPTAG